MISKFNELETLFREIDDHLHINLNLYIIGGAVLLYHGLKPSTKDIDVITTDKKQHLEFDRVLKSINFKKISPSDVYKKLDLSFIAERKDYRIDTFNKTVCKKLSLSKEMRKRADEIVSLSKLKVFLCSNEDILLFKSITEREGDIEDCISLIQNGVNWQIVLEEIKSQVKTSKQNVWVTWIGERFDILQERNINVLIIDEINKLRKEYFENIDKNKRKRK